MNSQQALCIFYAPTDGLEWTKYLQRKLESKYDVPCSLCDVTVVEADLPVSAAANVLLLTPGFLDAGYLTRISALCKYKSIIVLTGVGQEEFDEYVSKHDIKTLLDWYKHEMDSSKDTVRKLILYIISLFEENTYAQLPPPRPVNKIVCPFFKDNVLHLVLSRKADGGELKVYLGSHAVVTRLTDCAVYELTTPTELSETKLRVLDDKKLIGECEIEAERKKEKAKYETSFQALVEDAEDDMSRRYSAPKSVTNTSTQTDSSYFTPQITETKQQIPRDSEHTADSHKPTTNTVQTADSEHVRKTIAADAYTGVMETGKVNERGDNHNTYSTQLQTETTGSEQSSTRDRESNRQSLEDDSGPLPAFCECFGIQASTEDLDEKLTLLLTPVDHLCNLILTREETVQKGPHGSFWSTLLHFGARYNLANFCERLLKQPMIENATMIKNVDGQYPHDVAREHGHVQLAETLERNCQQRNSGTDKDKYDIGISTATASWPNSFIRESDDDTDGVLLEERSRESGETKMAAGVTSDVTDEHGQKTKGKMSRVVNFFKRALSTPEVLAAYSETGTQNVLSKSAKKRGVRKTSDASLYTTLSDDPSVRSAPATQGSRDSLRSSCGLGTGAPAPTEQTRNDRPHETVERRTKLEAIFSMAKRRNSARIQGALEDMNLSAPSIPGRDQVQDVQDTF